MSVLVVDDDRDLVDVITYILRRDGIEVTAAFDGQQAWERFQSEAPELVVLDITMPSMDGVELLRRMRTESTVPVVMLTARQDEPSIVEALDIGADDYITKPFSPRQLVARIRAVLRRASTYQPVRAPGPTGSCAVVTWCSIPTCGVSRAAIRSYA